MRRPVWPVVDSALRLWRRGSRWWSEGVGQAEGSVEPWVVGEDPSAHASAGGDDLAGDLYERLEEGAELHGEQPPALFVVALGPARGDW